jgi:hypothetical protein
VINLLYLGEKNPNQLTEEDFSAIAKAVNLEVPIGPELRAAGIAFLKGHNINKVADLVQSPEAFEELFTLLKGGFDGLRQLKRERLLELTSQSTGVVDEIPAFLA